MNIVEPILFHCKTQAMVAAMCAPGHALPLVTGAVVAFAVGLVALALLRRMVSRGQLAWFALYVLPLALATLAFAKALP